MGVQVRSHLLQTCCEHEAALSSAGTDLGEMGRVVLFWVLALPCGVSAAETGVSPQTNSASEPAALVAHFEDKELNQAFFNWGVALSVQADAFPKEPPWKERQVIRGQFRIGTNASQYLSFAWNRGLGQLHLDLNRNRDLTDDPQGVLSCRRFYQDYDTQVFTNVHLLLPTATGERRYLVDVIFSIVAGLRPIWTCDRFGKARSPYRTGPGRSG